MMLLACGQTPHSNSPPLLPGEQDAPCEVTETSYLIGDVTVPNDVLVDLSIPADGSEDSNQYPGPELQCLGSTLPDAIQRAFQTKHVLWVVTVETCADASKPYARITLEQGAPVGSASPPDIMITADDQIVGAVGTINGTTVHAEQGIGAVPLSVSVDVQADTSATRWENGFNVNVSVEKMTTTGLIGSIALAVDTDASIPIISEAFARTLTATAASDPNCPANCANSWLAQLLSAFDANADGTVTTEEVQSKRLDILNVYSSLDLLADFDGATVYWPNHDDQLDSFGTAFRFVADQVSVVR